MRNQARSSPARWPPSSAKPGTLERLPRQRLPVSLGRFNVLNVARSAARLDVGFHGKAAARELDSLLELGVSGTILFSRRRRVARSVAELTIDAQAARRAPLLTSVDQEGGNVARLRRLHAGGR